MGNGKGIDYSKLLAEQDFMIQGPTMLSIPENGTLENIARLVEEQTDDLVCALAILENEKLADADQALEEAVVGFIAAGKGFRALKSVAKALKESQDYELPKIGRVVDKLNTTYEQVGRTLKGLLEATKRARKANAQ